MYVGLTPQDDASVSNVIQLNEGEGVDHLAEKRLENAERHDLSVVPFEERLSRDAMALRPPRILLTNVNQLELLLTRGKDHAIFRDAPLRYLVMDEAHTYTGARGAEVAALLRRLKAVTAPPEDGTLCIGTSATLTDPNMEGKIQNSQPSCSPTASLVLTWIQWMLSVSGTKRNTGLLHLQTPDLLGAAGSTLHDKVLESIEDGLMQPPSTNISLLFPFLP